MAQLAPAPVWVCYDAPPPPPPGWELDETPVPESTLHNDVVLLVHLLLVAWAARQGRAVLVADNLALRWVEARPKVGLDPDVALYEPPPPGAEALSSVRTWAPGHAPPRVAVEVVSEGHPGKDYTTAPERYAASGAGELWVFDPLLAGPRARGGPHRLQVWTRGAAGRFELTYAGEGPCRSPFFDAWLLATDGGRRLRLSDDWHGARLWLTAEEAEREAKAAAEARAEAERGAKAVAEAKAEAERAAKEEAWAENERLRAELAALQGGAPTKR